jgi:hypothetical protein
MALIPFRQRRSSRGYVLLLVLMLTTILSIGVATLMFKMSQSAATSGEMIRRKRAFYATDGMVKAAVRLADVYFRGNPSATSSDLTTWFSTANADYGGSSPREAITPGGYDVDAFTIVGDGSNATEGPLPNGPFVGMNATQIPIEVTIQLRDRVNKVASRQTSTVVTGQVSAFQWFIFSEGYTDLFPHPDMLVGGRTHVNGQFCVSGRAAFAMENATASGTISHLDTGGGTPCRRHWSNRNNLNFAIAGQCPDFPDSITEYNTGTNGVDYDCNFATMAKNQDSGCVAGACAGGWATWVQATFNGSVADGASHGITDIKLPIVGIPLVQAGVNSEITDASTITDATDSNRASINSSSRLLVDPVLPTEPLDVTNQKFACKADIRIINGVWYLRSSTGTANTACPDWPGTPIWSDHPGNLVVNVGDYGMRSPGDQNVGQADLASTWAWNSADPPRFYSYYYTDPATGLLSSNSAINGVGTVSYGTLYRVAGTPTYWVPGFRTVDDGTLDSDERWCGCTSGCTDAVDDDGDTDGYRHADELFTFTNMQDARSAHCSTPVDFRSGLLQATRSGYKDGHLAMGGYAGDRGSIDTTVWRNRRAKQLPMNIDIAVLQAALASTSRVGELGWHFNRLGRDFNGIIWVTNTWPGQNNSYSDSADVHPETWPMQGAVFSSDARDGDPNNGLYVDQVTGDWGTGNDTDTRHQRGVHQEALPFPLCGGTSVAGQPYDHPTDTRFVVPDCRAYAYSEPWNAGDTPPALTAYPNTVRVHNGAIFNPTSAQTLTGHITVPANALNRASDIANRVFRW